MKGRFLAAGDVDREQLSWGALGWFCRPAATGAKHLTVIEVDLTPGHGHNFHLHPDQEEVLYVLEGEVEQWLEREKQVLRKGDAIFINTGWGDLFQVNTPYLVISQGSSGTDQPFLRAFVSAAAALQPETQQRLINLTA